jgi:transcriptional regulator with XRE-family HTH domain
MDYMQLFRRLREAKGLTLEQVAGLGRVHRNTIVNLESGRPVKFKTIARLMQKMGYPASSPELKSMALLWLEAVSGIPFSRTDAELAARKTIATYRSSARQAARQLDRAVADASLTTEQIELLTFAARHPDVIAIIENIRDLAAELAPAADHQLELKAAEDPGEHYGEK